MSRVPRSAGLVRLGRFSVDMEGGVFVCTWL